MKFSWHAVFVLVALAAVLDQTVLAAAKKPSRPSPSSRRSSSRGPSRSSSGRPSVSKRSYVAEEDDDEEELGFDDPYEAPGEDFEEEYDEEEVVYRPKKSRQPAPSKKGRPPRRSSNARKPRTRYEEDFDNDFDRPKRPSGGRPPSRRGPPPSRRGGRRHGSVVPYSRQRPSTFTRGLEALRASMPDPSAVREAAVSSLNAARETTANLSSNLYREVKGLTSSELEQVMLKATRPDDTAVKGKHVERLVGVTYQISARYDIYDAVLRKLWSKMAEKDWRTTIKALYILHRFSADGAPEHAPALKVSDRRFIILSF